MGTASTLVSAGISVGVALGTAAAIVLRHPGLLRMAERLWKHHAEVQVTKEQRRMASMALAQRSNLTHATPSSCELTVGTAAMRPSAPPDSED